MNEIESNLSKESADLDQYDDLFKKDWFIPVAAFNISLEGKISVNYTLDSVCCSWKAII